MSLTDDAARARRELALQEIEKRAAEVKARIGAERDNAIDYQKDALFLGVRVVMSKVTDNLNLIPRADLIVTSDGRLVGDPAKRRAAVTQIWQKLAHAYAQMQAAQERAEAAWDDARAVRDAQRAAFDFDLSGAAA